MGKEELQLRAFAKINLFLDIKGILKGGMHELDMLMRLIDLYDEVSLKKDASISVSGVDGVDMKKNIAYRAAKLFFNETGISGGVLIKIKKNIPMMSGMGGGSADAAAVLLGLDVLYKTSLGLERLMRMGKSLGADVPFMLFGGCARAGGIGEKLIPIKDKINPYYLIVKPHGGIPTADCFRLYDEMPSEKNKKGDINACIKALETGDPSLLAIYNALEEPAKKLLPEIGSLLEKIRSTADAAFMTGSGSTCIGLFTDEARAKNALENLKGECAFIAVAKGTDKITYA